PPRTRNCPRSSCRRLPSPAPLSPRRRKRTPPASRVSVCTYGSPRTSHTVGQREEEHRLTVQQPTGLLDGRRAVVTGASRNLGAAIAVALARHGARVAINYRGSAADAETVLAAAS